MKLCLRIFSFLFILSSVVFGADARELKKGTVIYGAVPPFFGGRGFRDLNQHIPRLRDLGVDVLWISPIYESDDTSGISYAVTDFFKIRKDFGTEAEFAALVKSAHNNGMHVILDIVPNHTSSAHRFFKDSSEMGRGSPYYNFFQRDGNGNPVYYFNWENLLNLNYSNPQVTHHIAQAFMHYMERFGVDGYRVDVAWGVKDRAPQFWPALRAEMNKRNPNVIMLAEASAQDPYYVKNGFDLAYDWTEELGVWAWKTAFEQPREIGVHLHRALSNSKSDPRKIARFLNNNDTGERFITRYGVASQRVAAVLQFTAPGVPILYMGDEVGAEFSPYEDPPPLIWRDPHNLTPFYRHLAALRELSPSLHSGDFKSMPSLNSKEAYAFARFHPSSGSWSVPVLNFGGARELRFVWPQELPQQTRATVLCDVISMREIQIQRTNTLEFSVQLSANSAVVLTKRDACVALRSMRFGR